MSDPGDGRRQRRRQFWQLHVPLAVALVVCTAATVIEFNRATDGVGRAWAYTVQWPLFGAFAVWMWLRYRREDRQSEDAAAPATKSRRRVNPLGGMVDHWRANVADAERSSQIPDDDPDLVAWREHVVDLRRREAAGDIPEGTA